MGFNHIFRGTIRGRSIEDVPCRLGDGNDEGAQFIMAHPIETGTELRVEQWGRERDSRDKIIYWVRIINTSEQDLEYDLSGGGFTNGFNHLRISNSVLDMNETREFEIQRGDGNDEGAQFIMANPLEKGAKLYSFNQTKRRLPGGKVSYLVTVQNRGSIKTDCDFSGGGMSNGFNHLMPGIMQPTGVCEELEVRRGAGEDQGAQFIMGNPITEGGALQTRFLVKKNEFSGRIASYRACIANISNIPTHYDLSGGGMT